MRRAGRSPGKSAALVAGGDQCPPQRPGHGPRPAASPRRQRETEAEARRSVRVADRGPIPAPRPGPGVWRPGRVAPIRSCRVGRGAGRRIRQGQRADPACRPRREAECAKQGLGHAVGGLSVVACRLLVEQLTQGEGTAGSNAHGQVDVGDLEAAHPCGSLDVASGARSETGLRADELQAVLQHHLAEFRLASVQPAGQSEALGEDHGRVFDPLGQSVQQRAVPVQHVLDGGGEQLLLGLEVVVEGTHPYVRGLSDLEDRRVDSPGRDEGLRSLDQRCTGACLATLRAGRGKGGDGAHGLLLLCGSVRTDDSFI